MAITATVDRFEGDLAVLLMGDQETVVYVHRFDLPPEVRQGDVLRLEVTIDREATEKRREEVREKIERLKRRS
jgi:FKBP-type peptidyl-prolyl cis-trans isomerase (trigger factor)